MSGEDDGVSTTGATAEQIEAAIRQAIRDEVSGITDREIDVWLANQLHTPDTALVTLRKAAHFLVPVGMVIASAADVATVPTVDELAALQELVSNAPGFDETLDALTVVRAYLERVTE